MTSQQPITVRFDQDLTVTNHLGEQMNFPAGSLLHGTLFLTPYDGPLGVREFQNPQFIDVNFEFQHKEKGSIYRGLLTPCDLWPVSGATVQTDVPGFTPEVGPVDGLLDHREEWRCILLDGSHHGFLLKYIGCSFSLMIVDDSVLVRCRYYDPTVGEDLTIFYTKKFVEMLFLKAPRLYLDDADAIEDFLPHGESYVSIEQ
ncbi:MAG TPA: hypothetical protein VGH19_09085 [Verrucomicrobiae bacterium]